MPLVDWPLHQGRPCVQIVLSLAVGGHALVRNLLADTGAGSLNSIFELILDEDDCLLCGGLPGAAATLGGAYVGSFPVYDIPIQLPALGFSVAPYWIRRHCLFPFPQPLPLRQLRRLGD